MLRSQILWETQVISPTPFPALMGDGTADVCIIGGGYTGLSAAIRLREAGKSVILLEAHRIGSGGSGRNVSLVNAGTWAQPDNLNKQLGEKDSEKLTAALGQAPKLVWDTIDRFNIDAKDSRAGNLHMAHNAKAEADINARYEQLTRRGADVEIIQGSRCHEMTGTISIQKALLDKRAGTINPYAYVTGLAKAANALGAQIFETSSVTQLEKNGQNWLVKTEQGSVIAEKVIIASNAYTEGEWTDILKSVYFVCYYQIATAPLEEPWNSRILPARNGSWDTRLALSSIRRDSENRLLFGTVGLSDGKQALYTAWANRMAKLYFPDLKSEWEYRWCGRFGFTPDHIMRIFEPANGIVAATGYNGRGITTGTLFGKALADYLLDNNTEHLPIPIKTLTESELGQRHLRAGLYDTGIALYHAGQCLRIVA
ncbi:Gamma-glutamylputrescine oxidoreductase [Suttonella ornithocola]|uniref:Gamma-glutamylputrescine oxidoreductase n=2 Tax=Suttonella ornithocola TaxID=279832 RepID=A0A380MZE7_9GAMM|nr:FAD-binding oxidoreductase [Suttonella ornithocola]SUO97071.1 Gamma-glutamylputrescine oxidoreductase [Suttonella ornithocola]